MRLIDADGLTREICRDQCEKDGCGSSCELINYVENAPTVNGWISVKDGLPVRPPDVCGLLVRRQWYLVALKSGTVLTLSYEFDEDRWQGIGSPVTHWMPLPEPPKEGS